MSVATHSQYLFKHPLSIAEAEVALFNPAVLAQLEALGVGQEVRDMVHLGTELEDVVSLAPERLGESVAEIQALALGFLRGLEQGRGASLG